MKFVAFLTLVLLAGTLGYSQLAYDHFDTEKMSLNGVQYGTSRGAAIKTFGQPLKKTNEIEHVEGFPYTVFHYKKFKLEFWYKERRMLGFDVVDPAVVMTYGSARIKVGDPVTVLARVFPVSYRTFMRDEKQDKLFRTFIQDDWVFFEIKNGKIASFRTWADNT